MATTMVGSGLVDADGAQLYHEVRGAGPPVVFVPGAFGDDGDRQPVAELLVAMRTAVTYDRRGSCRSPEPAGWTTTSMDEQAADRAALIEALHLERPVLFGSSGGGAMPVGVLERHAHVVGGAALHEPVLPAVRPRKAEASGELPQVVGERLEAGAIYADVPEHDALASLQVPGHARHGEETSHDWLGDGAERVSGTTGGTVHSVPGAHLPRSDRAPALVRALRAILESIDR